MDTVSQDAVTEENDGDKRREKNDDSPPLDYSDAYEPPTDLESSRDFSPLSDSIVQEAERNDHISIGVGEIRAREDDRMVASLCTHVDNNVLHSVENAVAKSV